MGRRSATARSASVTTGSARPAALAMAHLVLSGFERSVNDRRPTVQWQPRRARLWLTVVPGRGYVRAMGFLDRVIGAVNKVGTPIDSLTDTIGPSRYKKGHDLERGGRSAAGRIVGIERKLESGDDTELFALEFTG